jgi:type II secretory pathway pseudopilin PulG
MDKEQQTKNIERGTQDATRLSSSKSRRRTHGLTLIELVVAISTASIVMLTAALLISSGYRSWNQTYNNANSEARLGAMDAMVALGAIGRKSNKMDYRIYRVVDNTFEQVGIDPPSNPDDILIGQAVEFRYWDIELDAGMINPASTATAYALFYVDDGQLKVDYGPYPPGGINGDHHREPGEDVTTITLTRNVTSIEFSHTAKNITGDGKGCVRMKLIIYDTTDKSSKTVLAATLMRNVWPQ